MELPTPISREHLTREMNSILKIVSSKTGKYLRTHSCRASFITDMTNFSNNILTAKTMVGHEKLSSTERYTRGDLSAAKKENWRII